MNYDERIHQLRTLMAGKEHVERVLNDLLAQRRELEKQVWDLNDAKISEQQDVDKLEGVSLRSVILGLLGRKEERLDQERAELAAAVLKYDLAKRELDALDSLIAEKQQIMNLCLNAGAELERILDEKAESIDRRGGADAEELRALREKADRLEARCMEISEALTAGHRALGLAESALDALGSAGNWGTLDLFCDSMLMDFAKYNAMDEAKAQIERLQVQLRRFRSELADVAMDAGAEVSSEGFVRFADYFFDDIFTAFSTLNRVERAKESVLKVQLRVRSVLEELENQRRDAERQIASVENQIRNKVMETKA